MIWALLEALRRRKIQSQSFLSRASFPENQSATTITGLKIRYLDSWLMDEAASRELFVHGSQLADLSLIEGTLCPQEIASDGRGSQLETLCQWLRLPRIILLDASRISGPLPRRPAEVDGVLLDMVADDRHLARLTTDVQTVWRVPVLGSLPAGAKFSEKINRLPPGVEPTSDFYRELGDHLTRSWQPELLCRISQAQPIEPFEEKLFRTETSPLRLTVAVAFDEAFNRYFPCEMDMIEARGATIVDFSPLYDEHLPECDIVLLGGGHPERYSSMLADNHCMKTALRNHIRWGRRIYGEGGGLAPLCQQMIGPDGQHARMAGLLPAVARPLQPESEPVPVETTLARPNWLGHAGVKIRGYRNQCWALEPSGRLTGFLSDDEHHFGMMGSFHAIGSLLEVHFGTQSNLLNHFFYPHMPTPPDVDPWQSC